MEQVLAAAGAVALLISGLLLWLASSKSAAFNAGLERLATGMEQLEKNQVRLEGLLQGAMSANRMEMGEANRQTREELGSTVKSFESALLSRIAENTMAQKNQLDSFSFQLGSLTRSNEQKLEQMRSTLEKRVMELQADNAQKLDQMRAVVDEKLHATLEQRLGESFKQVSERLEMVYKGLGEMQVLASGVGDLKKMLSNVKSRGTWGEVQLGSILSDILSPDQYAANVAVKKNSERVEYAIKLPGPGDGVECVWLPLDAKFPVEDWQRLDEAYDNGDAAMIEQAGRQLENRIKFQAREISGKYIDPPNTTDFAIMFLPAESLYAEVLRRPALFESLRRDYRVNVAGPATLAALVNSLSMGFRTLAIQKRSGEVWAVLGAVKTEFGRFGTVLEKTQKKLQEASSTIDEATRRSRAMERKLRTVEAMPDEQVRSIIDTEEDTGIRQADDGQ